jgi:hypothetical protein
MEVPPEVVELCWKIRNQWGTVREMDKSFYVRALTEAHEYNGCYYSYWSWRGMKTMVVYRKDRVPMPDEFLPFMQELFADGTIQELMTTPFSRHFVQGEPLYIADSMAGSMGNLLADHADKKDEVEQFDFENTSTGKRLLRYLRNGTHKP